MEAFQQSKNLENDIKHYQQGKLHYTATFVGYSLESTKKSIKQKEKNYAMRQELNRLKNTNAVLRIFEGKEALAERYFDAVIKGEMTPEFDQYYDKVSTYF